MSTRITTEVQVQINTVGELVSTLRNSSTFHSLSGEKDVQTSPWYGEVIGTAYRRTTDGAISVLARVDYDGDGLMVLVDWDDNSLRRWYAKPHNREIYVALTTEDLEKDFILHEGGFME